MEKEMIRYGTYFTWKDKQENINTECNRACDLEGCALTLPTFSLTKVSIPHKRGEFVLKEDIKCEQVATLQGGKWDKMHDIAKRVYGTNGVAPTLHTCGGGNLEPKIMEENRFFKQEPIIYDDFNGRVKADQSAVGCLTTNCGNVAPRNGVKIIEPSYRVRKLTERECFKLMGVKVEDFSKIRRNQSKSSCYHLAGDSIVSTVLMSLFGQMLDIDWEQKVKELVREITK